LATYLECSALDWLQAQCGSNVLNGSPAHAGPPSEWSRNTGSAHARTAGRLQRNC